LVVFQKNTGGVKLDRKLILKGSLGVFGVGKKKRANGKRPALTIPESGDQNNPNRENGAESFRMCCPKRGNRKVGGNKHLPRKLKQFLERAEVWSTQVQDREGGR